MNEIDTGAAVDSWLNERIDPAFGARINYALSLDAKPDYEADLRRAAEKTGVPLDSARSFPDDVKKQAQIEAIDWQSLAQEFPHTARYLNNLDNARLSHDDIGNLTEIERGVLGMVTEPIARGLASGKRGISLAISNMGLLRGLDEQRQAAAAAHGLRYDPGIDSAILLAQQQRGVERYPVPPAIAEGMQKIGQAKGMVEALGAIFEHPSAVAETALQSMGSSAPALVGAVAGSSMGPVGTGAGAGAGSFAVEYGNTLQEVMADHGVDSSDPYAIYAALNNPRLMAIARDKAGKRAVSVATFDALTAGLAGRILAAARPGAMGVTKAVGGELGLQAGGGAAGEAVAQLGTDEYKPGDILMEAIAEIPSGVVEVPANVRHAIENGQWNQRRAEIAHQDAQAIAALSQIAAASKVRQRDAATFEAFVKGVTEDGPVENLYIDANALMQSGVAEQVAQASPAVAEQLEMAAATGGQIRIPLAEYAATLAGQFDAQLIPNLKTDPQGFSQAEAVEYMQTQGETLRQEFQRVLAEQQDDATFKASAETVKAGVLGQLDATGRFTGEVRDAYASFVSNYYAVTAAKLGTTPDALFAQYPLRVVAEGVEWAQFEQAANTATQQAMEKWKASLSNVSQQRLNYAPALETPTVLRSMGVKESKLSFPTRIIQENHLRHPDVPMSVYENLPALLADPLFIYTHKDGGLRAIIDATTENGEPIAVGIGQRIQTITPIHDSDTETGVQRVHAAVARAAQQPGTKVYARNEEALVKTRASVGAPSGTIPLRRDSHNRATIFTRQHLVKRLGDDFYQGGGARGSFSPSTNTIALLKNADLSTFLHETGHFFLEMTADLADRTDAPAALRQDMQTLLDWFGVKDLAEWSALSMDEKRAYHEKWAEGFEKYLFEGKAPSLEMQGLFQRFRAWMLNVYKSLKAMRVELTDEVRGVMDRMLATTEQIQSAEMARSMLPLFQTPEQAGMTPEEFKAYHDQALQATQDAIEELQSRGLRDMQWLAGAKSRELRRLQAGAKNLRAEVRREVAAEVGAQPVYRAMRFLRYGELEIPPDSNRTQRRIAQEANLSGTKLSLPALKKMYGEEGNAIWRNLSTGKTGLAATEGMHPDMVAELFGFTSGDHLVRELLAADPMKDVVEAITDQHMLERHGDLATPQALERAADAAIHNAARARFVTTEYNALAQATGQPRIIAEAARQLAGDMIARQRLRDLRSGQYTGAEAKAARAAQKAMNAGDLAGAAAQQRNRVLNLNLARAVHQAQNEEQVGVRYLRKFGKASVRRNIDADYTDQIDALLERYDLGTLSNKAADKRARLADWIESQKKQGIEPDLPAHLLDEAQRKPYRDMTVEEFRGLVAAVKKIEHLGRLKNRLLTARDQQNYEAARDEIVASIIEHAGDRKADTREPVTAMGRSTKGLRQFFASHLRASSIARILDGGRDGGPVWEYLIRPANDRADMETVMRQQATEQLTAILKPVLALGKMEGKGTFFPSLKTSLNREQRIAIALNTGNVGNMQRLLDGEGWSREQIAPVLQSLSVEEWRAVQAIWDHFEQYRPLIAEKERRVYGVEPEWVQPVPFVALAADGSQVAMRGGYYPVKYDPNASMRAEEHADAEDAKAMMQAGYTSATTRRSFTKARVEEVKGRPLLYSLAGLYSGVNEVIHDLSWHEFLIDANKLMRSDSIDEAIREAYGPEWKEQFKTWLRDVAQGDRQILHPMERAVGRLRHGVSIAGLGFNVMSAAIQPLGFTQSIVRIGPKYAAQGLGRLFANPLQLSRDINAKSIFMEERARTRFRELNELRNQVQGKTTAMQQMERYAYSMMLTMQRAVDLPTWWGAYEKAQAEGNDEARSVALADQAVKDSQGSGMTMDLSAIERGGPFVKLFTTFYTFMGSAFNLGVTQTMAADTAAKRAKLTSDYLLIYVLPPAMGLALKAALTPGDSGDDDPEKLAKKLAAEQVSFLMGMMVGLREFSNVSSVITGKPNDYAGPAGLRAVSDSIKLSQQTAQGEFDTAFRKAFVNTAGDFFGLPSAQLNRSITGIEALSEGKTDNPAAVIFGYQEPR